MEEFFQVAVETAQEAGALLCQLYDRPHQVEYKRAFDLVTEADRRSEQLIVERLLSRYPGHAVIAEEGGGCRSDSEYRWYVDPLDGTTNFTHGFPVFAVSIALEYREEMLLGVVYDPLRQELFRAQKGQGAYLNTRRLRVSTTALLAESLFATGFPPFSSSSNHDLNIRLYRRFTELSHGIRRAGSAALDLCYVAAGRLDGFWELELNPWDKAAGSLIVEEAGGRVSDLDNGPFRLQDEAILASNGLIHAEIQRVFAEVEGRSTR